MCGEIQTSGQHVSLQFKAFVSFVLKHTGDSTGNVLCASHVHELFTLSPLALSLPLSLCVFFTCLFHHILILYFPCLCVNVVTDVCPYVRQE